jgi:hypothetical protein
MEVSLDCNGNGRIDACDIQDDPSIDCELDGIPDDCAIEDGVALDCDGNGVPDLCDLGAGTYDDCEGNGVPDLCDLGAGTHDDCNANGVPDVCDTSPGGTSPDNNGDGIPDECQLLTINEVLINPVNDLNGDGTVDLDDQYIELVNFTANDVDLTGWSIRKLGLSWYSFPNGTTLNSGCAMLLFIHIDPSNQDDYLPAISLSIDESAMSQSGVLSLLDASGTQLEVVGYDANEAANGTSLTRCPDLLGDSLVPHDPGTLCQTVTIEDDLSPGRRVDQTIFPGSCSEDLDGDGVPDVIDNCDEPNPDQADCDGNGIGDICDISNWVGGGGHQSDIDCNWNGVLDSCELSSETDCDGNGVLDICDNAGGDDEDCNANGTPDNCEIDGNPELDCDGNGVPDECDVDEDPAIDCNDNGVPDICDIADGTSPDADNNGIPDECEFDPLCDLDGDNTPESQAEGILMIINYWECPDSPDCPADYTGQGDFDGDGDVDVDDLIGFTTSGCP